MLIVNVMPLNHLFDSLVVNHAFWFSESLDLPSHVGHKGNLMVQSMGYLAFVDVRC
jgi:hypothetical protein